MIGVRRLLRTARRSVRRLARVGVTLGEGTVVGPGATLDTSRGE